MQMLQEKVAYSRSSVESMMERIKAAASTRAPGEKVAIACSRIRTGTTPWAAIVTAIIQGDARAALDPQAETLKLKQLVAPDPAAFVTGVRKHLKIQEEPADIEWVSAAISQAAPLPSPFQSEAYNEKNGSPTPSGPP
ncbi:hypothetical protein GWG65_13935 [Bradyrhizobium sp. CSA207]|uniref:hypothetical protein n=1 Tax=Bradyrhizobium sp. CSA207 TaxID=2698826 RepID=UPI0023B04099|nr:hypothetical protein [Bradyrhizobium sp. CSA207]MDE5442529.1 hypothetical protein [Bradyrhizobium sp. CSA207]